MARGSNFERVQRLKAAQKRVKAGAKLSLTELAALVGVSKGAFVNLRNRISRFPEGEEGPGNSLLYDAAKAIACLVEYETRTDAEEAERQAIAASIIGMKGGRGRKPKNVIYLPPSEMLKLSRLRAEIEERERAQGNYIHVEQVRHTAARIYSTLADTLSQLEVRVDPNGLLPADIRERISQLGRECQLSIHRDLSDTLGVDADDNPSRAARTRGSTNGTKRAPARR